MNIAVHINSLNVKVNNQAILNDITFDLDQGQVLSIIGPNGAGKSTLLSAIAGDINYSGDLIIQGLGDDITKRARQLAVLPQLSLLNFPFRVHEVVSLSRIPHATGKARDQEIVEHALALMDINFLKNRLYTELSGGEKQRVQLARVFAQIWETGEANSNRVLLLDEPTTALDLGHQQLLMKTIRQQAKKGLTVVMVLHDVNLAASYSDKVSALLCSEQVAFGCVDKVITSETIKRLFDVKASIMLDPKDNTPIVTGI